MKFLDENGLLYVWNKIKSLLNGLAPKNSPALIGTPTAPTADAANNSTQIATTAFVTRAIADAALGSVSVYTPKGSKATFAELPSSGNAVGDVWNVIAKNGNYPAGTNYAWTGTEWDALGGVFDTSGLVQTSDLESITNQEIDTICV